ncbi:ferredoxin [Candidatus Korarchaeum cryptofilum]|jgi:Fe-S-cluster-containing dehydrogenase component|uniref:Ferredoxin n=1 Tax=Candidatus Korarchaeum cryptofilum TaxID=498846 RepID=A0A429G0V4_9CREN|nr:4Fe-4S dicluster domain-containing protein [Candidatus Korarchaeum cryptofilum]RSN67452.1 ferredoxin [Candidatus Korarchaeum cryptofilum]
MEAAEVCDLLGIEAERCDLGKLLKVVDYMRCIDCETCSVVCEFTHSGKSYVRLLKTKLGVEKPFSCFHCENAPCVRVCKKDAIVRKEDGGLYIIPSKCNKCLDCINACPFKAIRLGGPGGAPGKCDLCEQLRSEGLEPACIAMCPSGAIMMNR